MSFSKQEIELDGLTPEPKLMTTRLDLVSLRDPPILVCMPAISMALLLTVSCF